jgi:uncharacterized protein YbbC (DUF1343 family)
MRSHRLVLLLAWLAPAAPTPAPVRPGIEVLLRDSLQLVAGKRVALLTNQTGRDRRGRRDVDLLRAAPTVRLVRLFSPEHGFQGTEDRPALADGRDWATGLPIYNLYAPTHAPSAALLSGLDAVLIDLQDVGARYYTYVSTAVLLMEAAAHQRIPVIVLDRPDPLGGEAVQGNVREQPAPEASLVGFLPVPMRPGMTLGELLRLANDRLAIHASLTVVPMTGWRRSMYYDATGLPWIAPSPAMPSLESALHYPGTCLFEGTSLSVGRGTPFPFQLVGAPWLDTARVLERLRRPGRGMRAALSGVEVTGDTITPRAPTDGKYDGVRLNVLRLRVTDRERYDPTRAAVALLAAVHAVHPDSLRFNVRVFDRLAAGPNLRLAVLGGYAPRVVWREWERPLVRFRNARRKYLVY